MAIRSARPVAPPEPPASPGRTAPDTGPAPATAPDRRARFEWALLLVLLLALVVMLGPLPAQFSGDGQTPDPTGSVIRPGPIDSLDLFLYDEALRRDDRLHAGSAIIIDIDDDSLGQVGRWPWPRLIIASLVDRIADGHPEAVALDILFTEASDQPLADAALADSLRRLAARSRLILAVGRMPSEIGSYLPLFPLPAFAADATLAHAFFVTGGDGLVRGLYLQEGWLPALALALTDPTAQPDRTAAGKALALGRWPASNGRLVGATDAAFERVSAAALLRGDVDPARLRGRRVLVGATAVGAGDQFATPLLIDRVQASGVELHAAAMAALEAGHVIKPLPPAAHTAISVAVIIGLMIALWFTRPWVGLLTTAGLIGALVIVTFMLAWHSGRWLQPAGLILTGALAYPLWSWRRLTAASAGLFAQARRLERADDRLFPAPLRPQPPREPISAQLIRVQDAADQVEQLNRFLKDTIQRLPHPVLVADDRYRVMLVNEQLQAAFRPAPVAGESMLDWLGGALTQPALQSLTAARELQGEFRDTEGRHWMVDVSETGRGTQTPKRWLIQLVDITPLRLAEREREEALSFLSHDLRSPQAAILAMIDRARHEGGPALDLDEIERQARRALSLTDSFLQYARVDAKPMVPGEIDLEILTTEVADLAWFTASTRNVRVHAEGPPGAMIRADAELLRRALTNLVENGIRHTPPGGAVRICHAPLPDGLPGNLAEGLSGNLSERLPNGLPDGWLLTVEDDGPGVPAAIREQIFRPFWQPGRDHGGPAHFGAAGLGLAMVHRCIVRHGGSIRVTDRANAPGARFEIRLPAGPAAIITEQESAH